MSIEVKPFVGPYLTTVLKHPPEIKKVLDGLIIFSKMTV